MRRGVLLAAALLLAGAQAPSPSPVVAEAGDVKITAADVAELIAAATPDVRAKLATDPALLERLVRAQLVQSLLVKEAHDKQWDTRPSVAFLAQQARESSIANSYLGSLASIPSDYPSNTDVQAAFDAQRGRLMLPKQYHLAQIFIAVPPNAAANVDADARKRITALRQQLAKPHADFAGVARKESDDKTSAASGGDLGWTAEDRLRPPVRDSVAGMQTGSVSEPLRMDDGWHLVSMLGIKPAAPATLDDVRPQIVQALRQQKLAAAQRAVVDDLLKRDPIRLNEIELQKAVKQ